MTDDEYNGWSNRETWAANLWLQNDEGLYHQAREIARAEFDDCADWYLDRPNMAHLWDRATTPNLRIGEALVEWLEETAWEGRYDIVSDVGSFWRIDAAELGNAWNPAHDE